MPVAVRILHPSNGPPGPLTRALYDAHTRNARRLAAEFEATGAADVHVVTDPRDAGRSLGAILRTIATSSAVAGRGRGLIVLGAGSVPLARRPDLRRFLDVAASGERRVLTNNRYSSDIVAIGQPDALRDLPDLRADNGLPRWLEEVAGFDVDDLRSRWRLAIDLDSPIDVLLTRRELDASVDASVVGERLDQVRAVATDPSAELVVAGRTSATTLRWLERSTTSRTRALIEERGMRSSVPFVTTSSGRSAPPRPPASVLGMLLDDRGPEGLGQTLAQLGNAALVDSRVLLAHRLGPDERDWPTPEDRFASDMLLADRIADPWLRALTASARAAPIPVLLGGHTLVGPGVRLAIGSGR